MVAIIHREYSLIIVTNDRILAPFHSQGSSILLLNHNTVRSATPCNGNLSPSGAIFNQWNCGCVLNHTNCLLANCLNNNNNNKQ